MEYKKKFSKFDSNLLFDNQSIFEAIKKLQLNKIKTLIIINKKKKTCWNLN